MTSLKALERQDEGSKPNIEELEIVNLADKGEEPREVKIGTRCAAEQKEALIALLREFHEIFAWSYQDMPGLDTDIVVHKIPLKPECKPVKQALRRMKPEVILKIKEEVEKQLKAGFLSTVTYSDWVANIVPVPKKDGKVRMCVDYRDLNRASPKDNFPLPHIDTLVDNTATNVVFSFMDGFSGYNQIKMAEGRQVQDRFCHTLGNLCDDMIAKSRTAQDHLTDLRKLFQRLKKYQLRLNPNKCAFGVTSGKLLGFIVSGRGIEIDPAKVQAIRSMPAPKTEKEIRSFLGRINYIARFIAQLTANLRASVQVVEKRCEDKDVPSFYTSQSKKHPWAACWDNKTRLGRRSRQSTILARSSRSRRPVTCWLRKTCCALGLGLQEAETVHALLHHLVGIPDGPDQAIKGQAIADYLADYPSEQLELNGLRVPRRRPNAVGSGIGAVLVSPKGQQTPIAVKLGFDCTNNMTEYEACIVGLQAALEFGAYELEVFGDSLLIVSQTNGEWQARDPKLIPYQRYISRLVPKFKYVTFTYTPRAHNHFADALATLASLIKLVEGDDVRPLRIETRDIPAYCVCIEECMNVEAEIDDKPWYYDIKRFIQDREYPSRATENEKKYIRRMAFQFFLSGEILYKRTHDATLLRCVDAEEANRLIQEMHAGLMGAHANGPFLARKIMRAGYYWLTMERDCIRHVQTCHKCQMYQNSKNAPPQYLHTMASPWPFSAWGMDVIGAITPKASNGHETTSSAGYGMPEMLITDNASNLNNRMMDQLCQQFKIPAPQLCSIPSEDERSRRSCQQELRTSVGATPYSLVYGMEAVLPVEVEIPSLRILSQTQLEEAEWAQARVFLTRNKLICEPGHIGKRTHPCTTWNSRIAKNLSGSAGIPIGKLPSNGPKTPRWTLLAGPYLKVQARIPANLEPCKNRQRKLSDGTKNVKIRHRELGQICARTGTRFEKKRAGSKTHFFSRTAAFARRVFPARNKLIREPGCVGKIMTPATSWNSRFADSIPRLTGIRIGRVHKNSSNTPTSGSHNSLVRTPIRVNFISLERGRRELSDDMPHDPF
uniref:Uncharacterized protein n=1 Tax=Fagus sylvatica TaxID=28930 RepID=A0A2N9HPP3_FAGSY